MKRLILVLVLLFANCGVVFSQSFRLKATNFYSFPTDLETTVTKWDGTKLNLKISGAEEISSSRYPIGTEFLGRVIKHRKAKRFFRDEYMTVQVNQVRYPNGFLQGEDLKFKLRPRPSLFNKERIGSSVVEVTAFTFSTIFDATVVGLPISRGGYGIWYSVLGIQEREEGESKWKAGSIGFVKGIFNPIPQMLSKGRDLDDMKIGSIISLDREKKGRTIDALLRA